MAKNKKIPWRTFTLTHKGIHPSHTKADKPYLFIDLYSSGKVKRHFKGKVATNKIINKDPNTVNIKVEINPKYAAWYGYSRYYIHFNLNKYPKHTIMYALI